MTRTLNACLMVLMIWTSVTPSYASDCDELERIATDAVTSAEDAAELTRTCEKDRKEIREQRDEYRAEARKATVEAARATGRLFEVREREANAQARADEATRRVLMLELELEDERKSGVFIKAALVVVTVVASGAIAFTLTR